MEKDGQTGDRGGCKELVVETWKCGTERMMAENDNMQGRGGVHMYV